MSIAPKHLFAVLTLVAASACSKATTSHEESAAAPPPGTSPSSLPLKSKGAPNMRDAVMHFTAPAGWTAAETIDPDGHSATAIRGPGACTAQLDVWPGLPPSPGGPMSIDSSRDVTVDGVVLKLERTSMFQGHAEEVDALYANDGHAYARMVFRQCPPAAITQALTGVTLSAATKSKKP